MLMTQITDGDDDTDPKGIHSALADLTEGALFDAFTAYAAAVTAT